MKTETFKNKELLSALLFLLFTTTSCLVESFEKRDIESDGERGVTFSLSLPGQAAGKSTYALSSNDEEEIKSIEVLLFTADKYVATRTVAGREITTSAENKKVFTVMIPEGTYSAFVVLANSSSLLTAAAPTTTDSKESALAKLNLSSNEKWVANPSGTGYRAIPMWGELAGATVNQGTSDATKNTPWELSLTRMLAKISVSLTTPEATDNFKLQSIRVYNYYNKGAVAPLAANWTAGVATAASVPTGATKPAVTAPYTTLNYSEGAITTPDVTSTGEIYLFESDNKAQTDQNSRTCLVLGGTYTEDGKIYYYRVDFLEKINGTDIYLDLLRNHHYRFNVTKIKGRGYKTPDEAFSARPFNIEATVVVWNDAEIKNVATDGQYMLGVSQMEYELLLRPEHTTTSSDNKLTIFTDYAGGWKIASIVDDSTRLAASWLRTDVQSGLPNSKKTISLLLSSNNSWKNRSAKIWIESGTIRLLVSVSQLGEYYPPKHSGWAGSNIYWDGNKLTFDDVDVQTHKNYQGLYFKWASLTGVSSMSGPYDLTTLLYPPGGSPTPANGTAWSAIPLITQDNIIKSNPPSGKTDHDRAFLYELDLATGLGDICKYITKQAGGGTLYGKRWRMPTSSEFKAVSSYRQSGLVVEEISNTNDGTYAITSGATKIDIGSPFFPAASYRGYNSGKLEMFTNMSGYYWSASPSGFLGYGLVINSGVAQLPASFPRASACTMRCVAE